MPQDGRLATGRRPVLAMCLSSMRLRAAGFKGGCLEGTVDLQVRDGVIEIRAVRKNPREGCADDARRVAEQGDDALVWPEFANEGDDDLSW